MSALAMISTRDVQACEKFAFWQDTLLKLCGNLRTVTQAHDSFQGKIEYATISDVRIAKLTASPHRITRTPNFVKGASNDFLKVALQIKGASSFEQGSRMVVLSPREWIIYDTKQPYRVSVPDGTETLLALVPRESVTTQRIPLNQLLMRKFSGKAGMGKLAIQFLAAAFDEIPVIDPGAEWEIAGAISNLIRLTLLSESEIQTEVSLPQVWRERIKSYVVSRLRDPDLSIDQIALALNCTKRYIHKVFQYEGKSVSELILRMRLARCREDLRNPARSRESITDIAYSWGFNNPAHFSKAFKEEFNISPSCFRMESLGASESTQSSDTKKRGLSAQLTRLREQRMLQ